MVQVLKTRLENMNAHHAAARASVASVIAIASAQASAAGAPATIADLTTGIDFSTVSLGILAVAAASIGVYIIIKGAKLVVHAVKGM